MVVRVKGRNNHERPISPSNAAGRSTTTCLMACIIIILIAGQTFMFQSCQSQFGSALLESYGASFSQLVSSVSLTTTTSDNSGDNNSQALLQGILTGRYDVCIAGAGLSGSVLAERYASQLGYKVLVVEKRDHIGGNCYDYVDVSTSTSKKEGQVDESSQSEFLKNLILSHSSPSTSSTARNKSPSFQIRGSFIPHTIGRRLGLCTPIRSLDTLRTQSERYCQWQGRTYPRQY
jgi:NAD(P)-binding Rossmann-like domain